MFALFTSVNALRDCSSKTLEPTDFTSALGGVGSHVHGCSTSFNCNLYHWIGEDDGHVVELVCSDGKACGLAIFEGNVPKSGLMEGMLQSVQTTTGFLHFKEGFSPSDPHSGATGMYDGTRGSFTVRRKIVPSNGLLHMAVAKGNAGSSFTFHVSRERIQVEVPVVTAETTAAPVTTTVTAGATVAPLVTTGGTTTTTATEGTTVAPVKTTVMEGMTAAPVTTTATEGTTAAPVTTTATEETATVTVVTEETVQVTRATGKEKTAPEVPTTASVTPSSSINTPTFSEKGHALNVSDSGPGLSGVALTFIILGCLMVISVGVYAIYRSRTGLPRLSMFATEVEE